MVVIWRETGIKKFRHSNGKLLQKLQNRAAQTYSNYDIDTVTCSNFSGRKT